MAQPTRVATDGKLGPQETEYHLTVAALRNLGKGFTADEGGLGAGGTRGETWTGSRCAPDRLHRYHRSPWLAVWE